MRFIQILRSNTIRRLNKIRAAQFSAEAGTGHFTEYHDKIDASRTEFRIVDPSARKVRPPLDTLQFGRTFTDHMLTVDWNSKTGWTTPLIQEFSNFSISPASLVLHYGIECFEGMKAYLDANGNVRLFRPEKNMARFQNSMQRLALPDVDQEGLLECLKQLLIVDKSWIPSVDGYSLYIRPTAIATSPYLGVQAPNHARVFVILSPVGPYYKSGFAPVKLLADHMNVRAWPGGVGNVKLGGNYAPTIAVSRDAMAKSGAHQILWLFGDDHEITEVGAMNIFFLMKSKTEPGVVELITAPLTRGDILPGVTRDSIITIAKGWSTDEGCKDNKQLNQIRVEERFVKMRDVIDAANENRLLEVFGCGTAAIVSPVSSILYEGKEIKVPTGEKTAGPITTELWKTIIDIQYGRVPGHPWSVVVDEEHIK